MERDALSLLKLPADLRLIGALMQSSRTPAAVIYGLPGSGKTTVASYLSGRCPGQRFAISSLSTEEVTSDRFGYFAEARAVDYLLLEARGSCGPESLARRLTANSQAGAAVAERVRLDAMVAVVDASSFPSDFCSWDLLSDRGLTTHPDDDRAVVELLAEQIEFADVVILSKIDQASESARRSAAVLVRALNPDAVVIESEFGCVPPHKVLSTHAFDFARARGRARWAQVLSGATPNGADLFAISSFRYEARRPFHPQRLMQFVRSEWPGVVRCRGFFWLATRMDSVGELSQAGASRRHRAAGTWSGERRQQLAFVGVDMDESLLRSRLDQCLLDDLELVSGPAAWQAYADPFPPWDVAPCARSARQAH